MIQKHRKWNQSRSIMLYSDVDGTLVSKTNQISPTVVKQIEEFIQAGYGFSLATGRSLMGVRRLLQYIPVNTPVVLCNGAHVYDPVEERSWWTAIQKEIVLQIYNQLMNIPGIWIYADRTDGSLLASHADVLQDPFIQQECLDVSTLNNLNHLIDGADILKLGIKVIDEQKQTSKRVQAKLVKIVAQFHQYVSFCQSSDNYIEIIPAGVSKWSGILMSQSMRGCKDHLLYTIGDHHNDVEMIQQADVGIAMENAVDEVKRVATYIAGHVDDHAIVHVLQEIMEQSQMGYCAHKA